MDKHTPQVGTCDSRTEEERNNIIEWPRTGVHAPSMPWEDVESISSRVPTTLEEAAQLAGVLADPDCGIPAGQAEIHAIGIKNLHAGLKTMAASRWQRQEMTAVVDGRVIDISLKAHRAGSEAAVIAPDGQIGVRTLSNNTSGRDGYVDGEAVTVLGAAFDAAVAAFTGECSATEPAEETA